MPASPKLNTCTARPKPRLARVFLTLLIARVALKFVPFRKVFSTVNRLAKQLDRLNVVPDHSSVPADIVAQMIDMCAERLPVSTSCLPRAFACHLELRRLGYLSELKIGVARSGSGSIKAHAWVELRGEIVIGELPSMQDYTAFPEIASSKL